MTGGTLVKAIAIKAGVPTTINVAPMAKIGAITISRPPPELLVELRRRAAMD